MQPYPTSNPFFRLPMLRILAFIALAFTGTVPAAGSPGFVSESPLRRVEYWQLRSEAINAELANREALPAVKLVFLGDSITDFWQLGENPWVRGQKFGIDSWQPAFINGLPENRALNMGISGDRTEHVLYRIQPKAEGGMGQLDAPELDPEFIVLMIGVNNTWAQEDPVVESVSAGISSVLDAVHARKPKARIILQSLLPTNDAERNRNVVVPVNALIKAMAAREPHAGYTVFLDLYPHFTDTKGGQNAALFVTDGVHPNDAGYRIWSAALLPFLRQQRDAAGGAHPEK
jgi:lysophospholipase L1-like esterase